MLHAVALEIHNDVIASYLVWLFVFSASSVGGVGAEGANVGVGVGAAVVLSTGVGTGGADDTGVGAVVVLNAGVGAGVNSACGTMRALN